MPDQVRHDGALPGRRIKSGMTGPRMDAGPNPVRQGPARTPDQYPPHAHNPMPGMTPLRSKGRHDTSPPDYGFIQRKGFAKTPESGVTVFPANAGIQ